MCISGNYASGVHAQGGILWCKHRLLVTVIGLEAVLSLRTIAKSKLNDGIRPPKHSPFLRWVVLNRDDLGDLAHYTGNLGAH